MLSDSLVRSCLQIHICFYCRCEYNVANECNIGNGGCWEDSIDGRYFTACLDTLDEYKAVAAAGATGYASPTLHKCVCPDCFHKTHDDKCEPLCDLAQCESGGGDCTAALLRIETAAARKSGLTHVPTPTTGVNHQSAYFLTLLTYLWCRSIFNCCLECWIGFAGNGGYQRRRFWVLPNKKTHVPRARCHYDSLHATRGEACRCS